MGTQSRGRTRERGANLVEMALVLPLLALLLAGVADFGRAFYSYVTITNAAREGARYGSHFPHVGSGIRDRAKDEAVDGGVTLVDTDITIDPEPPVGATPESPGVAQPGEPITVTVHYGLDTIIGGIAGVPALTMRSSTEMIVFGAD